MKILIIGGTGLIGSEGAKELICRGHEVLCIALPPLPEGASIPPQMKISYGNFMTMTDEELTSHLKGCEGLVFAAGVDERVEGPAPIYELFKKYNIDPLKRLMTLAQENGIKHTVICGSYFAYFERSNPKLELANWHPYIRSRRDQAQMALSFSKKGMNVAVLELPYIFGAQPGRKPVWMFLVEIINKMKNFTLYPRGGTTMVTVKQVGQAIAGAIERNHGGKSYPIGYYNMNWKEMLKIFHKYMGFNGRKTFTIPNWLYALKSKQIMKDQKKSGFEAGLNMVKFTALQCSELFISKNMGCDFLGVEEDDIDGAIGDSVKLCLDILENKTCCIGMKGE